MNKKAILKELFKHYTDGNKAQFAKKIGVTPQAISSWEARNTFDIDKIYAHCELISGDWLLTGEGNMLRHTMEELPRAVKCADEAGIPLLPIDAMAGNLTTEQIVLEYECEKYVVPAFKGADFLMPVKGESMRPLYHSGDIVACKRVALNDLFFQWNKPYVIDSTQGPLIKRIKHGHDNAHISLVSENDNYEPFELPIDALNGVSLVIGIIRLE